MLSRLAMLCLLGSGSVAVAVNPASWTISESLTRSESEFFWTSPTSIDLGFDRYDYAYEITKIEATVLGSPVNVTSDVGESFDLFGAGSTFELPFALIDDRLDDPTTGTEADVFIEIDSQGFAQAAFTNVALGSVSLGPLRFNIEAILIEATIDLTGVDFEPGDFNGDGAIDRSDRRLWAANYGAAGGVGDANDDGRVDAADYTVWRDRFDSPLDAAAIPEPGTMVLGLLSTSLLAGARRR